MSSTPEIKTCKYCKSDYKSNGLDSCFSCHELFCVKCQQVSCEYIILGGENDPETAAECKLCKKIYHFDDDLIES
jgi:hypothetical protein